MQQTRYIVKRLTYCLVLQHKYLKW